MDTADMLLVLLTALLLPGMVALAFTFFAGSMERNEDAKYLALLGGTDEPQPRERPPLRALDGSAGPHHGNDASEEGRGWGS